MTPNACPGRVVVDNELLRCTNPKGRGHDGPCDFPTAAGSSGLDRDLELLSRFIVDHEKDLAGRSDGACKQCYPDNTWPGSFVCAQHRAREIQAALFTRPAGGGK